MGRFGILIVAAVTLLIGGGALYHFVFSPHRTQVVEGYRGPANAIGVAPKALSETALVGEVRGFGLDDRIFRTRFWEVEPGGVVPIHTHTGRPAIVYILEGEIQEYRNGSETPEVHHKDEVSAEGLGVVHYWRNVSDDVVHLWANDLYLNSGAESGPTLEVSEAPEVVASGIERETMTQINLAGEQIGAESGILQLQRITIAPGGRTAVNASSAPPLSAYLTVGDLELHRSGQETTASQTMGADTHIRVGEWAWWENTSDAPATLIMTNIGGLGASASVATEAAVFETQD